MLSAERLNNRYEIIRELGDGGFGKTYLVRDTQMPSARECVVKQLKPHRTDAQNNAQIYTIVKERFQREAAILEQLGEHDQVPRLYAYFSENDRFYLVEEYVQGKTLTQTVLHDGIQSETSVRSLLVSLLPAIIHVHQQKMVHRDIKPDNIILRESDGKPVLIDFGSVKETMTTVMNTQGQSTHSIVLGTPGYMPPEQVAGRPIYSTDLYSLGLTAIFLLTGKIPQELGTDPATGNIVWRQLAPNVSPEFAAFLDRAIQMAPQLRFSSAQEMFMVLNALTIGMSMPPSSMPPNVGPQVVPEYMPHAAAIPVGTVISAQPLQAPYKSGMPTQVSMPQTAPQASYPTGYPQMPVSAAGGEWKKAVLTGGIIGVSILLGAMVLKGQNVFAGKSEPQPSPSSAVNPPKDSVPPEKQKGDDPVKPVPPPAPQPVISEAEKQATARGAVVDNVGTNATIIGSEGDKNIRSGPGTKYAVQASAYTGDRINILASSRDDGGYIWHKVFYPKANTEGWMASQLVRVDSGTSAADEMARLVNSISSSSRPSSSRPSTPKSDTNATITGQSGTKNVRSGPGTNNAIAFSLQTGERVKVIGQDTDQGGYQWYKIYSPQTGSSGWVAAQLLRLD
jgi:serine/threonine protein kinase, bacterial